MYVGARNMAGNRRIRILKKQADTLARLELSFQTGDP
jgi:hypothetical protein